MQKSGCTRSATSSASGTRRTSALSYGGSTTVGTTQVSTSVSSRSRTGPSSTSGSTSPRKRSRSRRYISLTGARCSAADGMLLSVNPFVDRLEHEEIFEATVRYGTVGDMTCTGAVDSSASNVWDIIEEIAVSRITERGATRADDKFSEAAMEDRKREGYF